MSGVCTNWPLQHKWVFLTLLVLLVFLVPGALADDDMEAASLSITAFLTIVSFNIWKNWKQLGDLVSHAKKREWGFLLVQEVGLWEEDNVRAILDVAKKEASQFSGTSSPKLGLGQLQRTRLSVSPSGASQNCQTVGRGSSTVHSVSGVSGSRRVVGFWLPLTISFFTMSRSSMLPSQMEAIVTSCNRSQSRGWKATSLSTTYMAPLVRKPTMMTSSTSILAHLSWLLAGAHWSLWGTGISLPRMVRSGPIVAVQGLVTGDRWFGKLLRCAGSLTSISNCTQSVASTLSGRYLSQHWEIPVRLFGSRPLE